MIQFFEAETCTSRFRKVCFKANVMFQYSHCRLWNCNIFSHNKQCS